MCVEMQYLRAQEVFGTGTTGSTSNDLTILDSYILRVCDTELEMCDMCHITISSLPIMP
jgi:hypothetical protein